MSPAEMLLRDAQEAPAPSTPIAWKPYREAVMVYRSKGWTWPKIYARMVELGIVPGEARRLDSFRCTMCRYESEQRKKARAALSAGSP